MRAKSLQPCLALCNPMDCSSPDSSVHGILQARILEWVTMPSFRGSSRSRDQTKISCVFCIPGGIFTTEPLQAPILGARLKFVFYLCFYLCMCMYVFMYVYVYWYSLHYPKNLRWLRKMCAISVQLSSVQLLTRVRLFVTP